MEQLLKWYKKHKRDLPWRQSGDPYRIWLSEVILQQTRVNQGIDYYRKFIDQYPTIFDLAIASSDEVMNLWQGLGYYSRARNMHAAAKEIVAKYDGIFPDQYEQLIKLKGVGRYTAAAILSIAFDNPIPVVDGNVYRILSRFFGEEQPIDSSMGKKTFEKLAHEIFNEEEPGLHNQALMDLGAMVCKPKKPLCEDCPLKTNCIAYQNNTQNSYPVKTKKLKKTIRYFVFFILKFKGSVYIEKRIKNDIWRELYQFPVLEMKEKPEDKDILKALNELLPGIKNSEIVYLSSEIKHILTHQIIYSRFLHVNLKENMDSMQDWKKIEIDELDEFAFPRIISRYIDSQSI